MLYANIWVNLKRVAEKGFFDDEGVFSGASSPHRPESYEEGTDKVNSLYNRLVDMILDRTIALDATNQRQWYDLKEEDAKILARDILPFVEGQLLTRSNYQAIFDGRFFDVEIEGFQEKIEAVIAGFGYVQVRTASPAPIKFTDALKKRSDTLYEIVDLDQDQLQQALIRLGCQDSDVSLVLEDLDTYLRWADVRSAADKDLLSSLKLGILGQGAFGVVRLGVHLDAAHKPSLVAIKEVSVLEEEDPKKTKKLFENEVAFQRQSADLGIGLPVQASSAESVLALAMTLSIMDGFDFIGVLNSLLKEALDRCPDGERSDIGVQITGVVISYLDQLITLVSNWHEAGNVHRDLKPENFMISNNEVKLGDFGRACSKKEAPKEDDRGTLGYRLHDYGLGKEKITSEGRDDFALGITLGVTTRNDFPIHPVPRQHEYVDKETNEVFWDYSDKELEAYWASIDKFKAGVKPDKAPMFMSSWCNKNSPMASITELNPSMAKVFQEIDTQVIAPLLNRSMPSAAAKVAMAEIIANHGIEVGVFSEFLDSFVA